ncbi:MAG: hypothetical protein GXP45_04655 [bacterium]|nr:hypothetical protein [bacterium]
MKSLEELDISESRMNVNISELIELTQLKKINISYIHNLYIKDKENIKPTEQEKEAFKKKIIEKLTDFKKNIEIIAEKKEKRIKKNKRRGED